MILALERLVCMTLFAALLKPLGFDNGQPMEPGDGGRRQKFLAKCQYLRVTDGSDKLSRPSIWIATYVLPAIELTDSEKLGSRTL
jgi:hypothetical protein